MRVQDIVSGDEIISDTWTLKEIDDAVYEIDCKMVTKGMENIGQSLALLKLAQRPLWKHMRCFHTSLLCANKHCFFADIGANPSAEEQEETLEEGAKQVIDVVDAFRLNHLVDEASGSRAFGTKKEYMGQLKSKLSRKRPSMAPTPDIYG